jgi:membrane peptidoglycan carboxypeptidase
VDAAAEVYYGKAPAELTLAQSAFLAGLPQSPSYYGEPENFDVAKKRQEIVLGLMLKYGFITEEEQVVALAEDVHPHPRQVAGPQEAPHFINYVLQLLNERYGADQVNRGGLKVFTTIDLDYQHLAEKVAREQVTALQADDVSNAAVVAMNPRTGEIMAMLGSIDFNQPDWGQVNVAVAPRQPGSALKPIMYATALKQGYSAATMLPDIPLAFDSGAGQQAYKPTDYDNRYRGPVSMRQALANSLNIPAVAMLKTIGIGAMLDTAQAMGIHSLTDPQRYGLSVVLGGGEVQLLELTNAYGTLANGGRYVPPVALLEVRAADGKILEKFDAARTRAASAQNPALSPQQAYVITDILSDNEARTPLYGPNSALRLSRPAAAKTGTTNDYKDSWTLGYSPDLVTGVWVGNNDGLAMSQVAGARGAGPIWHNFMETVLTDPEMEALLLQPGETTAPVEFSKPPNLVRVPVCVPSGLKPSAACPQVRPELFIAGTEPTEEDNLWKMFKVYIGPEDVSSPLLAGPDCPPDSTVDRPFLVLPPEYQEWAKAQPTPVGPPTRMIQCAPPTPTATPTPEWSPTPVPGIGPIVVNTPDVVHPTPVLPDDFAGAVALITSPRPGASLAGEVTITGSADATVFSYYQLEWGAGVNPATWTLLGGVETTAVRSGVLGTWNTSGLPEGPYVLRLTLVGRAGQQRQVLVPVAIELSKPTVSLTSPQPAANFATGDKVMLSADASGPQGVVGVEFYVDGVRVAVAYAAPYVAVWTATPGDHILHAIAYSPHNSSAKSDFVNITVGAAPTVTPDASRDFSILAPSDNSTLPNKPIVVLVATPPNSPVTRVNFYVDGVPVGSSGAVPFQWSWTPTVGRHTILAIGYLADGKELARAQTTVYINPLQ